MYKSALLFAILILATVQAQLISDGECNFSEVLGANSTKLLSNESEVISFYEIERISNTWNTGHCTSFNLTVSVVSGLRITVEMKEVLDHKLIERNANVTAVDKNFQVFNVVFPDFTSNFTFIGEGKEFAVAYACSNVGTKKHEYAWVLGLSTKLTETDKNATQTIKVSHKLNNATWVENSHTADSCKSGTNYITLSPIIVLIAGFLVTKGL